MLDASGRDVVGLPTSRCVSGDGVVANYDQRFQDQQRQVDELKQAQGSVYGARDVIMDLRQRLDRVERERIGQP